MLDANGDTIIPGIMRSSIDANGDYLDVPQHIRFHNPKTNWTMILHCRDNQLHYDRFNDSGTWVDKTVLWGGSQTITHETNIQGEIGTFCETNGGLYDGYEKIDTTDCICQAVQSTTLNAKIVGIITSETQFASHGDVLMKVVPGTYKLGDILCPDISGLARVATETEKQYMMLNAIPRPKITSLNTGTPNVVACFII